MITSLENLAAPLAAHTQPSVLTRIAPSISVAEAVSGTGALVGIVVLLAELLVLDARAPDSSGRSRADDPNRPDPAWRAELTMSENVAMPLQLFGMPRREAHARARAILDKLDLTDESDRAASDASLGQQQRMALARAAVADPIVLLADEPTSHRDAGHSATLLEVCRSLVSRGTCIVVASHDPAVSDAADRVLDLDG